MATFGPPDVLLVSLKDASQPLLDIMPDPSTAILASAKGIRYPIRFLPDRMSYDAVTGPGGRDRAKKAKSPKVGYWFAVLNPDHPDQQLTEFPADNYKFSVAFTGPTGTKNVTAEFKRSTKLDKIQIDH